MNLIILASGSGKRLKKLTKNCPKCLIEINGIKILEYLNRFIKNFQATYLVAGFKANLIKKFIKKKKILKLLIIIIIKKQIWFTASFVHLVK